MCVPDRLRDAALSARKNPSDFNKTFSPTNSHFLFGSIVHSASSSASPIYFFKLNNPHPHIPNSQEIHHEHLRIRTCAWGLGTNQERQCHLSASSLGCPDCQCHSRPDAGSSRSHPRSRKLPGYHPRSSVCIDHGLGWWNGHCNSWI
jgi:hypothetical protein